MRHKLIGATEFKALQMLNERFRVCAISGAMDGVTSELNPGWVHRRVSAFPEAWNAQYLGFIGLICHFDFVV